jgi:hypothetical protein
MKKYLLKLLRQRAYLLKGNIGNCNAQIRAAYTEVEKYAQYYSNEQVLKEWVKKNYAKVLELIPSNDGAKKQIDELNKLLQS